MNPSRAEGPPPLSRVRLDFDPPLVPARFVERPNRFVVHAELETGERVVTHLPDPGRLKELLIPGRRLRIQPATGARKTRWTTLLAQSPEGDEWVCVDTTQPNRLLGRALGSEAMSEFGGWRLERAEYPHGRSRFDFLLSRDAHSHEGSRRTTDDPSGPTSRGGSRSGGDDAARPADGVREGSPDAVPRMVVEAKSVSLVENRIARFPDAVTARGTRHLEELAEIAAQPGWEAAVIFVLQRGEADRIVAAADIDPDFAGALAAARRAGVRVLGRRCRVDPEGVELLGPIPVS